MTVPGSIFAAAALAVAQPAAGPRLPDTAALEEAFNALETCSGQSECGPPQRKYVVHESRCLAIPPLDGRPSVACRVDETLVYPDPSQTIRYHDFCVRLARRSGSVEGPAWTVVQIRDDRPCEVPTILKRDPNPLPKRDQIEHALVAYNTCYDLDGATDCFDQPKAAPIEAFRCKPISPGPKGEVRTACRITGQVTAFRGQSVARLRNACVRLQRTTPVDQSPAHWVVDYVPEEVRCELR